MNSIGKEELKSKAGEKHWYLADPDVQIPQEVIDWAIGEDENIYLDYLLERWREEIEGSDEELPHEKRRIITEKRVIDLKIFPNEASYKTKFFINDIENITQDFSINAGGLTDAKINPSFKVQVYLKDQEDPLKLEPRPPANTSDKEDFKELILTLTNLRFS